jgi:adenylate kinase
MAAKKQTFLILFGAQGSGKGTQARLLQEKLGVPQVATGDLLRTHVGHGTELGKLAKPYMDRGELVPDSVTVAMVEDRLSQPDAAQGVILDGFPRNLAQAQALDAMLAKWNTGITAAVYLQLAREELMRRITGRRTCQSCQAAYHVEFNPPKVDCVCDTCGGEVVQRGDDADEAAVARRLELYFEQTTPVVEYYRGQDLLKQVDGGLSIEGVQQAMQEAIKPRRAARAVSKPKAKPAKKAPAKKPIKKVAAKKPIKKTAARKPAAKKTTKK